jgi:hypothetical protein
LAKKTFLDFEQPIAELESKIEELRYVQTESAVDISEEIDQLSTKSQLLTKDIYSVLSPWQITKQSADAVLLSLPRLRPWSRSVGSAIGVGVGDAHAGGQRSGQHCRRANQFCPVE